MKKALLALFLLGSTAHAKPVPGLYDYGELLSPDKFSEHCVISDPGISGSAKIDAYTHGQVSCDKLQALYGDIYVQAHAYLDSLHYSFSSKAPSYTIHLRVLTLAELNDPDNFAETNRHCMYNAKCRTGAYFGRTFYSPASSNINVYVVYPETQVDWKFSFVSSIKHELMHAILYRYRWNILLGNEEHTLIDNFLEWKRSR